MIIGYQKGCEIKEKICCNFGMLVLEGYCKVLCLMEMVEWFKMLIIIFIDILGVYLGVGVEECGQLEVIVCNLCEMLCLSVLVICIVIGEGGFGGVLVIGVGDKVNMFQYSIYLVILLEGCVFILWKSVDKVLLVVEVMGIIVLCLKELKLIDFIVLELLGGVYCNLEVMVVSLKVQLLVDLVDFDLFSEEELLNCCYQCLMSYGYV